MARKASVKEVKKRRPKASTSTMIKRYQAKLARLKQKQKLIQIKDEVSKLSEELKTID